MPGELTVASARASGGSIILSGGLGGDVAVSGKLAASGLGKGGTIAVSGRNVALSRAKLAASSAGGQGGSVTVTGTNAVSLASTAVDASGATGGGDIRIGGDFHGAERPHVRPNDDDQLGLDAQRERHGIGQRRDSRRVVERDDEFRRADSGDGRSRRRRGRLRRGLRQSRPPTACSSFAGGADLAAPKGTVGTLLLDPYDIVISTDTNSGGSFSGGAWVPTGTSVINNVTLENLLAGSNVVVSTGGAGSPDRTRATSLYLRRSRRRTLPSPFRRRTRSPLTRRYRSTASGK